MFVSVFADWRATNVTCRRYDDAGEFQAVRVEPRRHRDYGRRSGYALRCFTHSQSFIQEVMSLSVFII